MSSLQVDNIQTYNSNPPVIKNVSGTEVGTFCRAWVNFNGTSTVAIRASYNVSSITDNGTGRYTINFTNAFVDTNYALVAACSEAYWASSVVQENSIATTSTSIWTGGTNNSYADVSRINVAIFR